MRTAFLMTTGLAWLALTGAASAAISLSPGPEDPQYFAGQSVGATNFTIAGDVWSLVSAPHTAGVEIGTTPNFAAAPLGMGTSTTTGTPYMAVEGGGTEQVVLAAPVSSITIYWGSIDGSPFGNLNSVTIGSTVITGADLVTAGADGTGNQSSPAGNQSVTISGIGEFQTIQFSSTENAFEFSLASVPEPSTWAMMVLGFAGLGYAAFRRNTKGSALAI
jgi:PEP-CTERM motif